MKALIVEDDFTSLLLLHTILSRYCDAQIALNGKQAVEAFAQARKQGHGFDLVCMDIMMPHMDGQEALRQIRAQEEADGVPTAEAAKVIMTTALNDFQNLTESFHSLCDAYLVKPIDTEQLLGQLKKFNLTGP
jgi:two-component system chemotaxis response regulator CheY